MTYPVAEIFRSLQGEGHFTGYPMTFVRLAGCSLYHGGRCAIGARCDTEPTKAMEHLTASEIVDAVGASLSVPIERERPIVVITGGEPADHDLIPLVNALTDAGCRIHVETSGQKSIHGLPVEWITVSPKSPDYVQREGHTLKIVVMPEWGSIDNAWGVVRRLDEKTNFLHRYLQPLTLDGEPVNRDQVLAMVLSVWNFRARWALSTQAHLVWGIW